MSNTDDESFDPLSGPPLRKTMSSGAPPPASAFGPPASAFASTSNTTTTTTNYEDNDDEAPADESRGSALLSAGLNDRWKQYETQMESRRNESSLGTPAEAQPYALGKSASYDTNALIRKYGGMAGIAPTLAATPPTPTPTTATTPAPLTVRPADVRLQAQKVLDLVDDHLEAPLDIARTKSGGFRAAAAPVVRTPVAYNDDDDEDPYSLHRTASGTRSSNTGGKRVPAALSGLTFTQPTNAKASPAWNGNGRYSFSDPSFKDDDHMSDEEDNIIHHNNHAFQDEPVVDVVRMESRSAGSRPYRDDPNKFNTTTAANKTNTFEGDFEGGSKTWSSRYSDTTGYAPQQKQMLDQWDREFAQQQERKSARNMFMSTANSIRSSASNVFAGDQKKVFGSAGYSFRSNHVFGKHKQATEKSEVNLRNVWKEVDEDVVLSTPRNHKTWQEVMLNKRRRRRICALFVLIVLAGLAVSSTFGAMAARANRFRGPSMGETVTFYVTSDTPYDAAGEAELTADLINIPNDSEFLFHLGNIQDSAISYCPDMRYSDVASVLKQSPVPVLIVPGEEDWAKCPSPPVAFLNWGKAFLDLDTHFKHGMDIKRDVDYPEALAFLHQGVLFLGLHVVSGPVYNDEEWLARERQMLKFYFGMSNLLEGQFRSIVLLGNARPTPQQTDFFTALFSNLEKHQTPVAYIHAHQGNDEVVYYHPFEAHPQVVAIAAPDGSAHPPLEVEVGFGADPFVTRQQRR